MQDNNRQDFGLSFLPVPNSMNMKQVMAGMFEDPPEEV